MCVLMSLHICTFGAQKGGGGGDSLGRVSYCEGDKRNNTQGEILVLVNLIFFFFAVTKSRI